ncbi:hypothetical protein C7E23_03085 [Elizabethkingia anophelis]|nr:hypothetical protein C7E23_03085 [Elizabethkingia anophelis]
MISGKPDELYQQSQKFKTKYFSGLKRKKFTIKEKKILESIFNYSWFIKKDNTIYNAYNLCEELKIESCVYCNRLYTSTVINEKREEDY